MNSEILNEMLYTKDLIKKYLSKKAKEFDKLQSKLSGIVAAVSVENVELLLNLSETRNLMTQISGEYLDAKKSLNMLNYMINGSRLSTDVETQIRRYYALKEDLIARGIIDRITVIERDENSLIKKVN